MQMYPWVSAAPAGLIVAGLFAIVAATLFPFTFTAQSLLSFDLFDLRSHVSSSPQSVLDVPRNVMLFMPFGCGLAWWLRVKGKSRTSIVLFSVAVGLVVTVCVESLQLFVPNRTPSLSDIAANVIGTALGHPCIEQCHRWLKVGQTVTRESYAGLKSVVYYCVFVAALFWILMWGITPRGWSRDAEAYAEGDSMSAGSRCDAATDIVILDRGVGDETAAELLKKVPYFHHVVVFGTTKAGESMPISNDCRLAASMGINDQFTIALTVSPVSSEHRPVPLIAITSLDGQRTNLLLERDETRLSVRWRSFITERNNLAPALYFPTVFDGFKSRRIVFTMNGLVARLYKETGTSDAIVLTPDVIFSALLRETDLWPVNTDRLRYWSYASPLPVLVFFPLGFLVAFTNVGRLKQYALAGILPAGIETLIWIYSHDDERTWQIVTAVLLSFLGFCTAAALAHCNGRRLSGGRAKDCAPHRSDL